MFIVVFKKKSYREFPGGPRASLVAQTVKSPPAMQETQVWSLGWDGPPELEMATHSSILAWRTPWTEECGGLQSIRSWRVGYDWATEHKHMCWLYSQVNKI